MAKFDFVIGNPPYQDETVGDQKQFAPPVYDKFLNVAYNVGKKVVMITPGRFLFNAGGTSKQWNQDMLSDPHLKILFYKQKSEDVFPNTDIKGGIAITYHDEEKQFEPIGVFTLYEELNSIKSKVWPNVENSFSTIIPNRGLYRFSKKCYQDNPDVMKKITDSRVTASSFNRLNELFSESEPNDGHEYIQIFGLLGRNRTHFWIRKDYIQIPSSLYKYKIKL